MAAFWKLVLKPMKVAGFDPFKGNPFIRWQALTRDRVSHVRTKRRALRVLVVEDELDAANELIWLVRRWGHAARLACDGHTALQFAAEEYPDVVLMDMNVPLMDGCQVARQLRLDCPGKECFIIAATGQADDALRQQCTESGIDLLFVKPVDAALVETLLLLECELVNRSWTDNDLTTKVSSHFAHAKRSADKRESGAKTARTRLWQALRSDNYRRSCYESGGFTC